jgi:peptide/nickel transport system ATP-binding protein
MTDAEWENVRRFMRAVSRRTLVADDRGEQAVRSEFFSDGTPSGEAGDAVAEAIDALLADDVDRAETVLTETFAERSICAREEPAYEVEPEVGTGSHFSACHLHR